MNDFAESPLPPPPPPEPTPEPPRRSPWPRVWATLAWIVILALMGWDAVGKYVVPEAPQATARDEELSLILMRAQARYFVGTHQTLPTPGLYEQAQALNTGTVGQRFRFVVLAGELHGPIEALHQLRVLNWTLAESGRTYTPQQATTRDLLTRLYGDYEQLRFDAPSLSRKDRKELRSRLGWFGELALAPDGRHFTERVALPAAGVAATGVLEENALPHPQTRKEVLAPANRTFITLLAIGGGGCVLGVLGLAGFVTFIVLVLRGYVRSSIHCGETRGGVYAETFALWLVIFKGMPLLAPLLPQHAPRLLIGVAAELFSLIALGWPVLRGIPWRQVRTDLGLTAGTRPAVEPLCGLFAYVICVPLVVLGVLITAALTRLERALTPTNGPNFEPTSGPAHPIVFSVAQGDFWVLLEVLLLACVLAPLVEETMFRGVLFRNLREATSGLGRGWSFFLSATVVSFLFAAVHPQGLVAIPVLMALAYSFSIAREWRGSLVPGMVAHAVNNGFAMTLAFVLLGG